MTCEGLIPFSSIVLCSLWIVNRTGYQEVESTGATKFSAWGHVGSESETISCWLGHSTCHAEINARIGRSLEDMACSGLYVHQPGLRMLQSNIKSMSQLRLLFAGLADIVQVGGQPLALGPLASTGPVLRGSCDSGRRVFSFFVFSFP